MPCARTLSTGLYTPYLGKHLARFKEKGIPYKAYEYTNPVDGELMYVLMTFNPSTGNVIEIHGSSVALDADAAGDPRGTTDDGSLSYEFGEWDVPGMAPLKTEEGDDDDDDDDDDDEDDGGGVYEDEKEGDDGEGRKLSLSGHGPESGETTLRSEWRPLPLHACELAVSTMLSKAHLEESWAIARWAIASTTGLPFTMLVKVSHPSMDVHETAAWMEDNAGVTMTIKEGASVRKSKGGLCKMAHAAVKKWKEAGTASLIYVQPMNEHAEDYVSGDNAFFILLFSSLLF